jgi:Dyp-type peroxidase family
LSPASPVNPGEFIFGYENAYQKFPFSPTVPAALDANDVLAADERDGQRRDLGRNGSYLVIRKLEQDVDAFWQFMREHSRAEVDAPVDEGRAQWLASRFMGRWPSGAPVALCPLEDDAKVAADPKRVNDFGFHGDPAGLACPLAAHVRRTNPRDAVSNHSEEESLTLTGRHRLLRRGRSYEERGGPAAVSGAGTADGAGGPVRRGIMFVALNTNIRRQFEFIQHTWVNNPKFAGLYDARDPVVGANHEPQSEEPASEFGMVIPGRPLRTHLTGIPRFVHTRGGGYFFLPGRRALQFLAGF